jgi:hypothetical protein
VIGEVHANSRGTYGRLRVQAALRIEHGLIVNQKLVARIMRELKIHGLPQRKRVTRNLASVATHDGLVLRNFVADRPNAWWLTDIERHERGNGLLLLRPGHLFVQSRGLGDRSSLRVDTGERRVVNGGPHENHASFDGHSLQSRAADRTQRAQALRPGG